MSHGGRLIPPARPYSFPIRENEWGGLYFNGSNGYVSVPNAASLNPANISILLWIKPLRDQVMGTLTYSTLFLKGSQYWFRIDNNNGKLNFYIGIAAAWKGPTVGNTYIKNGVISHVAATYDGSNQIVYTDSIPGTPRAQVGDIDIGVGSLSIDRAIAVDENSFYGIVYEAVILGKSVTKSDVRSLMEGRALPTQFDCRLWHDYRLGHAQDLSGNGNHGTLIGGVSWV